MRGVLLRIASVVVGLTLAAVLVEAVLAVFIARRPCRGRAPFWRPSAEVGWELVPNMVGDAVVCDEHGRVVERHRVAINDLGLRDRPRSFARGSSGARVLVLGDSYVEAMQVDLEETFLARLERALGAELIAAGVSGYSTDNELRAFERWDRRFTPDVVLLVFFVGNDVLENGARLYLTYPHGVPPKPWIGTTETSEPLAACYRVARGASHVANALPEVLWEASRLMRWGLTGGVVAVLTTACRDAAGPGRVPARLEIFGVYGAPESAAWEEAWDATETNLAAIVRRVRERGAEIGVVVAPRNVEYDPRSMLRVSFPGGEGRDWDFRYPYERLGARLSEWNVPWMSLVPAFAAHYAETGRTGAYAWDGHWDAEGHAVVATALEPFVASLLVKRR